MLCGKASSISGLDSLLQTKWDFAILILISRVLQVRLKGRVLNEGANCLCQ